MQSVKGFRYVRKALLPLLSWCHHAHASTLCCAKVRMFSIRHGSTLTFKGLALSAAVSLLSFDSILHALRIMSNPHPVTSFPLC